jgi:phosphatidylinositol alpha-mannosyltransferase
MKKSLKMPSKNTLKNRLKIGLVLDDTLDTPDGVQQYVLTLGRWLTRQGHEVHYLVGETKNRDDKNIHSIARNIKVKYNQNRLSTPLPTSKKLIKAKLKELNLDIIHIQTPYSPLFAGRVISLASPKTKIIGTFHVAPINLMHQIGARALRLMSRQTLKQFDQMMAVSLVAANFARRAFGLEAVVVPIGINSKALKHKPVINKTPTIVFLGRLVERKGCQYLLKALAQLQKQYKGKYQVIIGGRGPLKAKLEGYVISYKLKNVKFIGFVEEADKPALLASADIAVFPSTGGESFGISLIEPMIAGARVVLGGDNVGYRGVLGANPELLINPKDTSAFANRLQYFLENKLARQKVAKWGKETAKQYDIEAIGPKIVSVYRGK